MSPFSTQDSLIYFFYKIISNEMILNSCGKETNELRLQFEKNTDDFFTLNLQAQYCSKLKRMRNLSTKTHLPMQLFDETWLNKLPLGQSVVIDSGTTTPDKHRERVKITRLEAPSPLLRFSLQHLETSKQLPTEGAIDTQEPGLSFVITSSSRDEDFQNVTGYKPGGLRWSEIETSLKEPGESQEIKITAKLLRVLKTQHKR